MGAMRSCPKIQILVSFFLKCDFKCITACVSAHTYFHADVVYIGVIHPYHLRTCLLFINSKKNVLCEKPLAMNTREVQEILAAAKRNNVFLMEVNIVQNKEYDLGI